jgi:hypothetical protein
VVLNLYETPMDWVLDKLVEYWDSTQAFFAFEAERLFDPYVVTAAHYLDLVWQRTCH